MPMSQTPNVHIVSRESQRLMRPRDFRDSKGAIINGAGCHPTLGLHRKAPGETASQLIKRHLSVLEWVVQREM
jgi:hypothetical protein